MEIYKLIEAKQKSKDIIESCDRIEHLYVAKRYIDRFYKVFEDSQNMLKQFERLLILNSQDIDIYSELKLLENSIATFILGLNETIFPE